VVNAGDIVDGRFRLVERVGAGGMGVVFRALDGRDGGVVALKLLEGRTPVEIERARREANALARLSHPAIVRHVADGVLADSQLYLAMEWVEGLTVADRIAAEGFTLREAVAIARRVADALASAHRAQVLHRDLKPSNILLAGGDPYAAKLIDFGIARVRDAVQALTRTGAAVGTPGYMSPEQARGEREVTPAADVFGLGCVLYECATGKPAFSGLAVAAVLAKILFADPAPLEAACPEAPAGLVELVARMLAKETSARFRDCDAVVSAIDALSPASDGPRRTSRRLTTDATQVARAPGALHCMVAAARGALDDVLEPPTPDQLVALVRAANAWDGRVEVLATGAVIAHLTGEAKDTSHRAAHVALAVRRILPGWSIVVSSVRPEVDAAAEDGTALLTQAAVAAIFGKQAVGAISVDPSTAAQIDDAFELAPGPGGVTLVRSRGE
jgi:hypothetical protein